MLQQTRVEVVRDYYTRWMASFPDVETLALANEDDVLSLWQGLGYYSRARRLLAGARHVVSRFGGQLPESPEELQKIPGLGPYSAGAISSIAYGRPSPIVDGNVVRVLTRWCALSGDPAKAPLKKILWELAGHLVPARSPADFNQGLMELGATICTPKSPACHACPVRRHCAAHATGEATRFPEIPKRPPPTALSMVVLVMHRRGQLGIQKLPPDARWWAGLHALPFAELGDGEAAEGAARRLVSSLVGGGPIDLRVVPSFQHSVTRYKIALSPIVVRVGKPQSGARTVSWVSQSDLGAFALPAPHRKALRLTEI